MNTTTVLLLLVMVAVIVGVDLAFFRGDFSGRLIANVVIVLVSVALYYLFFKR